MWRAEPCDGSEHSEMQWQTFADIEAHASHDLLVFYAGQELLTICSKCAALCGSRRMVLLGKPCLNERPKNRQRACDRAMTGIHPSTEPCYRGRAITSFPTDDIGPFGR